MAKRTEVNLKTAGMLIGIGAIYLMIALFVSEALYPGYSISNNYISDLGVGASAWLFNFSVILLGALIITGAYFLRRGMKSRVFPVLVLMAGVGAMGVGIFNEHFGMIHVIASVIAFLFGNLAAVYYGIREKSIIRYPSIVLGVLGLAAMGLSGAGIYFGIGYGGMERIIIYPMLLWAVLLSGRLISS